MLGNNRFQALEHLADGLEEFGLVAVATLYLLVDAIDVFVGKHTRLLSLDGS